MSGPSSSINSALRELAVAGPGREPAQGPRPFLCGDIAIRIARDGTWYYHGSPIGRKPLVKLFASVLRREADGDYWLVTPVERGRITVEDAPFTAVEVNGVGQGRDQALIFRTNLDEDVTADGQHPIRIVYNAETQEPRPYILVREGLEALILRPVFYELVRLSEMGRQGSAEVYGVWSKGQYFTLGRVDSSV